jgi:hypothetical protein
MKIIEKGEIKNRKLGLYGKGSDKNKNTETECGNKEGEQEE